MAMGKCSLNLQRAQGTVSKRFVSVNVLLRAGSERPVTDETSNPKNDGDPAPAISFFSCSDPSFAALNFFLYCCDIAVQRAKTAGPTPVKFILPAFDGYVIRSDLYSQRLMDSEHAQRIECFCTPRQYVRAWSEEEAQWCGLFHIISRAMGAILLKEPQIACALTNLAMMEAEMANRLSCHALSERPIARQTVALVDVRSRVDSQPILSAAKALGIEMVVLGSPGHWLSTEQDRGHEAWFVPIDMTPDQGFPLRIIRAIENSGIKIDGMTSNLDWLTLPVATAAAFLGVPCESLEALNICRDKYRQRQASGDPALQVKRGENVTAVLNGTLEFPMVVKPSGGLNSEGVSKVSNRGELETAVDRVFDSRYDYVSRVDTINIEEYCPGPEIDVNVVLFEGEMLVAEIADDFPKAGDDDAESSNVFKESAMLYPSALPSDEQEKVLDSLHRTLLNIGLCSGIYHVEARVNNSRKEYIKEDGLLALRDAPSRPTSEEPSVVLIEVNARLPGLMCRAAANSTYGIDYHALHLLISIGDSERIRALCQPFLKGPQYWCETCFITADRGGVFKSGDLGEKLQRDRPDLACHVSSSLTYFEGGEVIPPLEADSQPWIAWFLVFSRVNRQDLLQKVEMIREAVTVEFE